MNRRTVASHHGSWTERNCTIIYDHVIGFVDTVCNLFGAGFEVSPGSATKRAELSMGKVYRLLPFWVEFRFRPFHVGSLRWFHIAWDHERIVRDLEISRMAQVVGVKMQGDRESQHLVHLSKAVDHLSWSNLEVYVSPRQGHARFWPSPSFQRLLG